MAAADDGEGNHVVHEHSSSSHHFLVVSYGMQSHVNPGRVLAQRLARLGTDNNGSSILATLSVSVATHRRMFPSLAGAADETTTTDDGVISYAPYSNGFDDGSAPKSPEDWDRSCRATSRTCHLRCLHAGGAGARCARRCAGARCPARGVLDPAGHGPRHLLPLLPWLQRAHHRRRPHHGPMYEVRLPGTMGRRCPLRVRDLPSYLVDSHTDKAETANRFLQQLYEYMDQWRPRVLVNTSYELEAAALTEMDRHLDIFAIGPAVRTSAVEDPPAQIHLFKHDDVDKKGYMDWLGAHRDKTVVYVSFGSVTKCTKLQMEEVVQGLRQCGRPYLLVVRKDRLRRKTTTACRCRRSPPKMMRWGWSWTSATSWRSSLTLLWGASSRTAGGTRRWRPWCRVCRYMYLMEREWSIGVRGERDSEGVLMGTELARCIEVVMGEGTEAMALRERAGAMKEMAREIADAGGLADRNLRDFVQTFQAHI